MSIKLSHLHTHTVNQTKLVDNGCEMPLNSMSLTNVMQKQFDFEFLVQFKDFQIELFF